ncbi:MAG: DUF2726 domain-containing protein [Phycisphaeraceae bacterium]
MSKNRPRNVILAFIRWLLVLLFGVPEASGSEASRKRKDAGETPYVVRPDFLSEAEERFDRHLERVAGMFDLRVHRKVRIADVLLVPPGTPRWQHWFNRVSSKHVDFLISLGNRPVAAIELDDRSHARGKRVERDKFVNEAFRAAGLPLLRVRVASDYHHGELETFFRKVLDADYSNRPR